MAVEWVKVGTNVVVGGGAGAVDQMVQNWDKKRAEAKAPDKLGIMAQAGTYFNYGLPALAILGTAFGFLKGEWADRAILVGSQLAGRKATYQVTKPEGAVPWTRNRQLEAGKVRQIAEARAAEARAAEARKQVAGPVSEVGIPVIANETVLV